jgi:glyoxylase-like metal-dependent hydrolase (beta-lactamase superfamily II)
MRRALAGAAGAGIGDGPVPFRLGSRWASDYGSVTRLRLLPVSGSVVIPAHGGAVLLGG